MTDAAFSQEILDRLRSALEVEIETHAAGDDGSVHRAIIWVVVDGADRVLVRSYRGPTARWYREATSGRPTALVIGDRTVPTVVERAVDDERVVSCSEALERKYAGDPSTDAMVRDEVLETTLELHPGPG